MEKRLRDKKTRVIDETTPLLVIAGPMFVELLLNIFLNNIDTIMLSHYSENAVGAVGNANQVMFLIIMLFNIIATATSVVVAQYLGAEQFDKMNQIYTLAVVVNLVFGIVLSAGLVAAKGFIMKMLNVSDEMMPDAMIYMSIVGGGLFLQAVYNVMLQILRCNGHTKVGMYISVVINLINIVGNFTFLYGPLKFLNLGVAGVAISTVTSRVVALTIAFVFFYRSRLGKISLSLLNPFPGRLLYKMLIIGLPSAGENLSYSMYQMVLLAIINSMGNNAVNAKVYCNSLISFAMVFSNASAMATQIITGHLVGAGKEDAAYKRVFTTLKTSMPITIALAAVNWLISPFTLRIFTNNEEIIHLGYYIMLVDIFIEVGRCLNMTFVNSLKAAGDYLYPLIIGLITMWGLGVTVGYVLGIPLGIGVAGVFMGTATDECIRGIIVMQHWRKRKWVGKAVINKKS
ncbi:MAG: MATE family efflux transporter [Lachnospiraceae bacterium]|nr:MATE family efflux transporter [Lachnospiraceae bacterium]MEE0919361.1 MATE family efflux transporter [Lachnospiraceae bacterium]